jgi:hypothetical protein
LHALTVAAAIASVVFVDARQVRIVVGSYDKARRFQSSLNAPTQIFVQASKKCNLIRAVQLSIERDDSWCRVNKGYGFRFVKTAACNVENAIAAFLDSFECIKRQIGAGDSLGEFRCAWLNSAAVRRNYSRNVTAFSRSYLEI